MSSVSSRIMIFGRPGGGKSTFSAQLHKRLNIPLYHLDKYFYISNWVERYYPEFIELQQKMVDEEQWIIDGNSTKSLEMRWARATRVIYFNYPRRICYWRVFKRLFAKDPHLDDRAEQCSETIRWSLLKYMWTFNARVSQSIALFRSKYPDVQFYEIRNDQDLGDVFRILVTR